MPILSRAAMPFLCCVAIAVAVGVAFYPAAAVHAELPNPRLLVVSPAGGFLGGAILPGPALMARALAEGTSRLPAVADLDRGLPPVMPGRSTQAAIAAGIGFGMRGAVARLVAEAVQAVDGDPEIFLTGGSRGIVRDALPGAIEIPDLVLHGIALAVGRLHSVR